MVPGAARFHQVYSWFSSRLAAAVARTASREVVPHRLPGRGLARGIHARDRSSAKGMRQLGYEDGKNIAIHYRFAEGDYDRLPTLAAELVHVEGRCPPDP